MKFLRGWFLLTNFKKGGGPQVVCMFFTIFERICLMKQHGY